MLDVIFCIFTGQKWPLFSYIYSKPWHGHWYFLWSKHKQTVEQTVELLVCWDAMMLMWRHWNASFTHCLQNQSGEIKVGNSPGLVEVWLQACNSVILSMLLDNMMGKLITLTNPTPLWILLTHWGRVTHICVSRLTIIGSDNGLDIAWSAPSHFLNGWWNIVNWTLGNKLQWNSNRNSNIFI